MNWHSAFKGAERGFGSYGTAAFTLAMLKLADYIVSWWLILGMVIVGFIGSVVFGTAAKVTEKQEGK